LRVRNRANAYERLSPAARSAQGVDMNIALWVVQGLLAFVMVMAGAFKVATPREKLSEKMKWAKTWTDTNVKLLGLAEVLGGVGLVVPWVTGILPVLTPIAAVCLAILMGGAVKTHLDHKEPPIPAVVLGVLCVLVALGRFGIV
jgi:urea transporter